MDTGITVTDAMSVRQAEVSGIAFAVGFFFSFRLCIVLLSVHVLGLDPSVVEVRVTVLVRELDAGEQLELPVGKEQRELVELVRVARADSGLDPGHVQSRGAATASPRDFF